MGKTHLLIGGAGWLAALAIFTKFHANFSGVLELTGGWGISAIGALAPDIDSPKSLITKSLGPITKLLSIIVMKIGAIGDPSTGYMRGHRRLTHSLIGFLIAMIPFVLGVALWHLLPWVMYAFMVGWISHVLADMTTIWGCPLLWPRDKRYGLHALRTGSLWETHVIRPGAFFLNLVLLFIAIGGLTWV